MTGVLIEREIWTHRHAQKEHTVKRKAEMALMQLQAKDWTRAPRGWGEARADSPSQPQKAANPLTLDFYLQSSETRNLSLV